MKVMFEPKEGTDQPIDGIDVLSHAEIDDVVKIHADGDARPCGSHEEACHGHISALVG